MNCSSERSDKIWNTGYIMSRTFRTARRTTITTAVVMAGVVATTLPALSSSLIPPIDYSYHRRQRSTVPRNELTIPRRILLVCHQSKEANTSADEVSASTAPMTNNQLLQERPSLYSPAVVNSNQDDGVSTPLTPSSEDSEVIFIDFTDDGICVPAGPIGQAKERVAKFLDEPIVELFMASNVLLSSFLVAISTLQVLEPYLETIRILQTGVGAVLFLDFVFRWFSSPKEYGRFILDPFFFVDVLVVVLPLAVSLEPSSGFWANTPLPDWATSPSGVFNLRLFRVLRLRRILKDISTFERFERALPGSGSLEVQEWQLQLARVSLTLFTLVSVSTGLIYTVEHDTNPGITDYFTALYFGLTTLTTVGFGDITPVTTAGKFVVCGSIVAGVTFIPAQAAALVEALLQRQNVKKANSRKLNSAVGGGQSSSSSPTFELDTGTACSNCGAIMHWASAEYCYSCGKRL